MQLMHERDCMYRGLPIKNKWILYHGALLFLSLPLEQAQAACSLAREPGQNAYACDSTTGPGDPPGNNTLVFAAGGSGVIYASKTGSGQVQRIGVFAGQSRLQGDAQGFDEGFQNRYPGQVQLDGDYSGIYWTLVDPKGWYLDLMAVGTRLDGDNTFAPGAKINSNGHALALSAQAGYPIAISENWVVEPQIQLINQKIDINSQNERTSRTSPGSQDYWAGRLGARLKGRYIVQSIPVEPYLQFNTWRTFSRSDTVTYNNLDQIKTSQKSSSADLGAGVVINLTPTVSLYMGADYSTNLDANALNGVSGNVGLRVDW